MNGHVNSRRSLLLLALVGLLTHGTLVSPSQATDNLAVPGTAHLRDQLISGLKAVRPEQIAFIDAVVLRVDEKKLPLGMVYATFQWAIRRRPDYPFPHFERAMRVQAEKIGVDI